MDAELYDFFPRAKLYGLARAGRTSVREKPFERWRFPYSERHLQCVWFDTALRPAALRANDGEQVVVEDPGVWNLEAGPDFLGAALRIGPQQRRVTGDVEIHIHPGDWRQHGHAQDPRYDRVRAHVTYHPGSLPASELPPGAVQISLQSALAATPRFSFENVDLTAYPFATRAPVPPCFEELRHWDADGKHALLDAAGEERLRRKAVRLAQAMAERGADQALYEETMAALGFKHNKAPFRQLAESVPHDVLREESRGAPLTAYAMLAGVSGLLPDAPHARWNDEGKKFARAVWDTWWKMRDRFESALMPRAAWHLGGIRPANHPLRRLMAAARLFTERRPASEIWGSATFDEMAKRLAGIHDDYFDLHAVPGGKRFAHPASLIGTDRRDAILLNVWVPFLAAVGAQKPFDRGLLEMLPPEADNAIIRQTALNLFGQDHGPSLYRTGLRRQGLIQIFHDYCLNDRSRCAACSLPALLAAHRAAKRP